MKSKVVEVAMYDKVLAEAPFGGALAVYCHELLHQYGSDASPSFRGALLDLARRVLERHKDLEPFERRWHEAEKA